MYLASISSSIEATIRNVLSRKMINQTYKSIFQISVLHLIFFLKNFLQEEQHFHLEMGIRIF